MSYTYTSFICNFKSITRQSTATDTFANIERILLVYLDQYFIRMKTADCRLNKNSETHNKTNE